MYAERDRWKNYYRTNFSYQPKINRRVNFEINHRKLFAFSLSIGSQFVGKKAYRDLFVLLLLSLLSNRDCSFWSLQRLLYLITGEKRWGIKEKGIMNPDRTFGTFSAAAGFED